MGCCPSTKEQILHLHDMASRLKRIVTDMNDLSLADVGQLSLHLAPVNVFELVGQLQGNLEPVAEDAGLVLQFEVQDGMPAVMVDGEPPQSAHQPAYQRVSRDRFRRAGGLDREVRPERCHL